MARLGNGIRERKVWVNGLQETRYQARWPLVVGRVTPVCDVQAANHKDAVAWRTDEMAKARRGELGEAIEHKRILSRVGSIPFLQALTYYQRHMKFLNRHNINDVLAIILCLIMLIAFLLS